MLPHLYTNKEFTPTSRQNEKQLLDEATEGTPAAKRQPPLGDEVQATSDTKESGTLYQSILLHIAPLRSNHSWSMGTQLSLILKHSIR